MGQFIEEFNLIGEALGRIKKGVEKQDENTVHITKLKDTCQRQSRELDNLRSQLSLLREENEILREDGQGLLEKYQEKEIKEQSKQAELLKMKHFLKEMLSDLSSSQSQQGPPNSEIGLPCEFSLQRNSVTRYIRRSVEHFLNETDNLSCDPKEELNLSDETTADQVIQDGQGDPQSTEIRNLTQLCLPSGEVEGENEGTAPSPQRQGSPGGIVSPKVILNDISAAITPPGARKGRRFSIASVTTPPDSPRRVNDISEWSTIFSNSRGTIQTKSRMSEFHDGNHSPGSPSNIQINQHLDADTVHQELIGCLECVRWFGAVGGAMLDEGFVCTHNQSANPLDTSRHKKRKLDPAHPSKSSKKSHGSSPRGYWDFEL
eukprot:GHVH01000705.1.p1 GENE.GHVH01000705.1~~GHVH01000705.1.p1  ORF type:complete len:375 (+),score=58.27 GHVH01000705.1:51-1175(+)